MAKLIARRLAFGVLIVWLVSVIVFLATQLLPGDAARELLGRYATPASVAYLQNEMHLNEPALQQYLHWLSDLVTAHWGKSLVSQDSVATIVGDGVKYTGLEMILTTLIATPIAIAVGSLGAMRSEGVLDQVLSVLTLILVALPAFVIAITLIFVLATTVFHILPATSLIGPSPIWSQLNYVILPTATLVLAVVPYPIRMIRASMVEVLRSDYVSLARLHGISERRVIFRHALPNAIATTIQVTALNLVFLAGGVVVVETVFNYPGIGYAFVQAVNDRDIPTIQTIVVVLAIFYVLVNLVADVLVVLVTPRLRTGAAKAAPRLEDVPLSLEPLA
jgi:peptide/nickel transport system permease protein